MRSIRAAVAMAALMFLAGCGEGATITGEIRDNFGKPVEGATVSVAGGEATAVSDAEGRFAVTHVPGRFPVTIGRDGFTSGSYSLTLHADEGRPPVNATLQRLPPAPGLWIAGADGYLPTNPCRLAVIPIADPVGEAFLIQRGVPAAVPADADGRTKLTLVAYDVPESQRAVHAVARVYDNVEFYRTQPPANRDPIRVDESHVTPIAPEFPSEGRWFETEIGTGVFVYTGRMQPTPGAITVPDREGRCFFFSVGPPGPEWPSPALPPQALEDFVVAVKRCWPATPEGPQRSQVATLAVAFNPDGTLTEPPKQVRHPLDTFRERARYPTALADAITAVNSCAPYRMFPADAYEAWRNLTVTFSVAEMLAPAP